MQVDGTLVNSQQKLTPGVEAAVLRARAAGVPLIVATGKARGPWTPDVLPRLGAPMPGVFLQVRGWQLARPLQRTCARISTRPSPRSVCWQPPSNDEKPHPLPPLLPGQNNNDKRQKGLLICDAQGRTMRSRCLEEDVLLDCIRAARAFGVALTCYSDDAILCGATDEHTDRLLFYKEPTPEAVGDLERVVGKRPVQKVRACLRWWFASRRRAQRGQLVGRAAWENAPSLRSACKT